MNPTIDEDTVVGTNQRTHDTHTKDREMGNQPAHIDIVFEDHVYTATVYDMPQLRMFCSECVREGRAFRFGKIHQYGSIRISYMAHVMNQIRKFATYDRWIGI